MKPSKYIIFLLIIQNIFFIQIIFAQTSSELNEDLTILKKSLYTYHPGVFKYVGKDSLDKLFLSLKFTQEEKAKYIDLEKRIRIVLKNIGCIHTSIMNTRFKFDNNIIPYLFFTKGDSIWILNDLNDSLSNIIGSRVISINDHSSKFMIATMKNYAASDGYNSSYQNNLINRGAWFNYLYNYYFDIDTTKAIKIVSISGDTSIINSKNIKLKYKKTSFKLPINYKKHFTFSLDTANNLAIIKINSFLENMFLAKWRYKKIIKLINIKNIKNVIIDLRNNPGGYAFVANYFLSLFLEQNHVIDREKIRTKIPKHFLLGSKLIHYSDYFKYAFASSKTKTDSSYIIYTTINKRKKNGFKGNLFVFTNGGTASAASNVASLLKHLGRATIIGQETGGGEEELNGINISILNLPNSKIKIKIPQYHLHLKVTKNKGHGVIPDIITNYNIDNIMNKKDLELEKVLEIIK